ncbi:MAG: glycosyltransferase family 2 protein [Eubacteriales bacterium]|nr:glycosyltransferase family 2 protein [Eubacteriales bacterium]
MSNRLTISIAMCTYNGGSFLSEQLQSISRQVRLPDELVICDDGSADKTINIIETFVKKVSFSVRLYINNANLGSTKNFEKVIGLCKGNIIALSDQDDVWNPTKLLDIEFMFLQFPKLGAIFSDAEVVNEHLGTLGYNLWQSVGFCPTEQTDLINGKSMQILLKHNVVTGATMAFRAEYRKDILPIPSCWVHDAWIALIISSFAPLGLITKPLIKYRQHPQQQLGARRKRIDLISVLSDPKTYSSKAVNSYLKSTEKYIFVRDRIEYIHQNRGDIWSETEYEQIIQQIESKIFHIQMRANLPKNRILRLSYVFRALRLGHYYSYSNSWKSIVRDILF